MTSLMTIELKKLRFFGYHGLYSGEHMTGTEFEVNLIVQYETGLSVISDIRSTINYVSLFEIVKARMAIRTELLETIAMEMAETIKQNFDPVKRIEISIYKINPPIENFQGRVGIRFQKDF